MYLVRSVSVSDLNPKDLKTAVIDHFRNPMEGVPLSQPKEVLDFERLGV